MDDVPWKAIFMIGGGVIAMAVFAIVSPWIQEFISDGLGRFGF